MVRNGENIDSRFEIRKINDGSVVFTDSPVGNSLGSIEIEDRYYASGCSSGDIHRPFGMLGIAGMVLMALLSPAFSEWAFGDTDHTVIFVALSVVILLQALLNRETTVMRGLDRLRPLAKCSVFGSVGLLAASVPLLYFLRTDGIVPMIISCYLVAALLAYIYRVRDIPAVRLTLKEVWRTGRPMLTLGMYLTASTFITMLASNIFIIFLRRHYGDAEVGFYQAGYTLINTYVGMIFTSISMEYYPRLASTIQHRFRTEVIALTTLQNA